jgi:hypothetical protein
MDLARLSRLRESGRAFLNHQHAKIREGYGSDQAHAVAFLERIGEEVMTAIFKD